MAEHSGSDKASFSAPNVFVLPPTTKPFTHCQASSIFYEERKFYVTKAGYWSISCTGSYIHLKSAWNTSHLIDRMDHHHTQEQTKKTKTTFTQSVRKMKQADCLPSHHNRYCGKTG